MRLDERLYDLLAGAALVAQLGNVGGRQGLALVGVGEVAIVLLDLHIWKSFREGREKMKIRKGMKVKITKRRKERKMG